jgi:hypothetical protein
MGCAPFRDGPMTHFTFASSGLLTFPLGFCKFSEVCEQVRELEHCRCIEALERNGYDRQEEFDLG